MILVYTHTITSRLTYTLDLVFGSVLGIPHHVTDDLETYRDSFIPKIAYTNENKGFGVFIESDPLLFETYTRQVLPVVSGTYLDFPVFFKVKEAAFLPYDIFATVFYFASRYEEYLPYETDKHKRFQAEQSLAFKNGILDKPFLNYLIADFAQKLKQSFSILEFPEQAFRYLSTIDIDNAFAHANKGFKRNAGGMAKDLASFKWKEAGNRIQSNLNEAKDPYNTFDLINALGTETQTALQYFVLIGDYAAYDKNPDYRNPGFRKLLKGLSDKHSMGLHPSYESFKHPEKIQIEKTRLEEIIGKKITSARCHFLRIKFPDTYRHFIEAGITDDYTMIYASQCGFRTGLCMPYKWFDLQKNEVTELTVHSSVVMEGTLRDYNKLTAANAEGIVNQLLNEVKHFGGEFVSIFHNDSFMKGQEQWIEVYRHLLINTNSHNS
ncbi:MAG: polysaccharide deacetylase family protein [Bacteroidota bacterium]